jgi:hypothetical protein
MRALEIAQVRQKISSILWVKQLSHTTYTNLVIFITSNRNTYLFPPLIHLSPLEPGEDFDQPLLNS